MVGCIFYSRRKNRGERTKLVSLREARDRAPKISFDEFAAFFVRTSEAIIRYRKKVTERGGGLEGGVSEKQIIAEIRVPTTAEIEALTQGTPLDAGGRYWYNYR